MLGKFRKEQMKAYSIKWEKENKEKRKEQKKQYYQDNKERIKKKYDDAKAKAQEYRASIN